MKANLTIIVIAAVLSFFVTNANASCGNPIDRMICDDNVGTIIDRLPGPSMPGFNGELPPIYSSAEVIAVPTEQPSAQHLAILADIRAKNKEATRQWWINFFNNK